MSSEMFTNISIQAQGGHTSSTPKLFPFRNVEQSGRIYPAAISCYAGIVMDAFSRPAGKIWLIFLNLKLLILSKNNHEFDIPSVYFGLNEK